MTTAVLKGSAATHSAESALAPALGRRASTNAAVDIAVAEATLKWRSEEAQSQTATDRTGHTRRAGLIM
eukprot:55104-Prymnesium_polylepis.3